MAAREIVLPHVDPNTPSVIIETDGHWVNTWLRATDHWDDEAWAKYRKTDQWIDQHWLDPEWRLASASAR